MWYLAAGSKKSWGYWYIDNGQIGSDGLRFLWPNGTINPDLYIPSGRRIFSSRKEFADFVKNNNTGWFSSKKAAEAALKAANSKALVLS